MEPRKISDLSQLSDDNFLQEIACGMRLTTVNASRLWRGARLLKGTNAQGHQILASLAAEEAGKALILFDAARCPRERRGREKHLKSFNSHLGRGLYVEIYRHQVLDMTTLKNQMDRERQSHYLDGPQDVDWIFRRDIDRRREEAIYVDYVMTNDHQGPRHEWFSRQAAWVPDDF